MRGWHLKDIMVWCPVCNQWQHRRAGWFCWEWHRLPDDKDQEKDNNKSNLLSYDGE